MNMRYFTSTSLCWRNMLIDIDVGKVFRTLAVLLVTSVVFGVQTVQAAAGGPSNEGVQPIEFDGNPTCSDFLPGVQDLTELRVEPGADGTYNDGTLEVMISVQEGAKTFTWDQGSSSIIMMAVFVKGGPGGNLYEYYVDGVLVSSDGGLHSPVNPKNGKFYGLSHISFCYVPGKPEIEITKTCPSGVIAPSGNAIIYTYNLWVENTGTVPLFDIMTTDDTAHAIDNSGTHVYNTGSLNPGDMVMFSNTFTTDQNGLTNMASVKAAVEPGGEQSVIDDASYDCPLLSPPGSMVLDKECDTKVVVNEYGHYGLKVNYSGSVCNTSQVVINNVTVFEEHDGMIDPMFIGTLAPQGMEGDCEDFSGSYVPEPQDGEALPAAGEEVRAFTDTVSATGLTFFGDPVQTIKYPATCRLCKECPEVCPE